MTHVHRSIPGTRAAIQPRMRDDGYCEIRVIPEQDLRFTVRVSLAGKHFVMGGFTNPDEAQRRGVRVMCAMSGLQQ